MRFMSLSLIYYVSKLMMNSHQSHPKESSSMKALSKSTNFNWWNRTSSCNLKDNFSRGRLSCYSWSQYFLVNRLQNIGYVVALILMRCYIIHTTKYNSKYTQQKKKRTCDSTGIFSGMEFIWLRQRYMTEISNLSEIKICLLICYCVRQVCAVDR